MLHFMLQKIKNSSPVSETRINQSQVDYPDIFLSVCKNEKFGGQICWFWRHLQNLDLPFWKQYQFHVHWLMFLEHRASVSTACLTASPSCPLHLMLWQCWLLQSVKILDPTPKVLMPHWELHLQKYVHLEGYLSCGFKVLWVHSLNLFWQLWGLTIFCWSSKSQESHLSHSFQDVTF